MSLQSYAVCGHCDELLSSKALKKHRRFYFQDGEWIRIEVEDDKMSGMSSPLSVSLPSSQSETEDMLCSASGTQQCDPSSDDESFSFENTG